MTVRRNELDLTIGTDQTYAQIGYLRLNRDIDPAIEDLARQGRVAGGGANPVPPLLVDFRRRVIDLTDRSEDPLSLADGYQPIRNRLGIEYEDECLQLGLTWRRDYERIGAFRKGSTFAIHLALKGVSR